MSSFARLERRLRDVVRSNHRHWQLSLHTVIVVDLLLQQLKLYEGTRLVAVYPVSTSANGPGCKANSGCTPTGWHMVRRKIGNGLSRGTVFRGRVPGNVVTNFRDKSADDLITSRILWLDGLEAGRNQGGEVDSFSRYIYIHGTAQEHLIGRAVSHGCIRMNNTDVIALYTRVNVETPVLITNNHD